MKLLMKALLVSGLGLVVLGSVDRIHIDRIGAFVSNLLPSGGHYSDVIGQARAFDRQLAKLDQQTVVIGQKRQQLQADSDQDARLMRELDRLAGDRYGTLSPSQLREAVLALQAARAGDSRRLESMDDRVRELVRQRLAVLQDKMDLFDEQHRTAMRQYLSELIKTSEMAHRR